MIPVTDLQRQHALLRERLNAAAGRVIDSGWFILGPEVRAFEEEFAAWVGTAACVGVASGTDAITLALRALGIGAGDEVITVSHTAVATVAAIVNAGAVPVLVDINEQTFTMDPAACARAITPRTRAIVPVHLYGHPADMPAIMALAAQHGLKVIEDCAQAHGALCHGRRVGTWGDCAAFSFYPTKNLGALGDGGAVVTSDTTLAERLRELRQYGWRERYISAQHGMNSRLDEVQAALLREKLPHVDGWNAARCAHAARYAAQLQGVRTPTVMHGCTHVHHLYVVRAARRDALAAYLKTRGIATALHYPAPVHLQPAYGALATQPLLVTESVCRDILTLPMFPELREDEVDAVCQAVAEFYNDGGGAP